MELEIQNVSETSEYVLRHIYIKVGDGRILYFGKRKMARTYTPQRSIPTIFNIVNNHSTGVRDYWSSP